MRGIAMQPGTAARVPHEQASDVRVHDGGSKGSDTAPTNQHHHSPEKQAV
jgi:hypothetical protein